MYWKKKAEYSKALAHLEFVASSPREGFLLVVGFVHLDSRSHQESRSYYWSCDWGEDWYLTDISLNESLGK